MTYRSLRPVLFFLVLALIVLGPISRASARMDNEEWRQAQADASRLFGKAGMREEKIGLIARLVADEDRRSWTMLVAALVKEAQVWVMVATDVEKKEEEVESVQGMDLAKRTGKDQRKLKKWRVDLATLEELAGEQRAVVDYMIDAVAIGPKPLRRNLFSRARSGAHWALRVAAAEVAAVHPEEPTSFEHLSQALGNDSDPRVRMAGLEALRRYLSLAEKPKPPEAPDGEGEDPADEETPDVLSTAESLVLGRLADKEWGVQLAAVRVVEENKMMGAIPHLISALGVASPRVAEAIGKALRDLTGEDLPAFAEGWAKWWNENREKLDSKERVKKGRNPRPPSDAHVYGVPVNSDRVLFILDISSSMKEPTKNENPAEKWKPVAPVTGPGAPPPPPPPEEILSGPKIDVAKHELKKAINRLPKTCHFNVIAFSTAVLRPSGWEKMRPATSKNKADMLAWIRSLEPKGCTFVEGALRLGFRMAGLGAVDKAYSEVNIDTMLLICDGAPTDDDLAKPELVDYKKILAKVRGWNKHKRVVVNCIGVSMYAGSEFLQALAAENGGVYVDR